MSVTYPFDPTGLANTNIIVDEIHTLTEVNANPYRIVIPEFAPFYLSDLQVKHISQDGITRILNESIDYVFCLPYIGATRSIGQMIYGGISIINETLNGLLKVTYRTLGGEWTADASYVLNVLAEEVYNPRITVWDVVTNKQDLFPPINHDQSMDYVYGHQDLIQAINNLAAQVLEGPSTSNGFVMHLLDETNPHHVTKEQVGLGHVQNLEMATDAEVDNLVPADKYFTLRQLLLLGIEGQDPNLLADHTGNYNNPHQVTKDDVGLGSVTNLQVATDQDIYNRIDANKYITLHHLLLLLDDYVLPMIANVHSISPETMFTAVETHRVTRSY